MTEPTPIILSSPDAGNRGAGEILRRAREAQNMTLEGLASNIKVTTAKLEALEQGQFDRLPDANFTRALAMTVCRALKLDPTEVLAALPAAKPTALAEGKPPLNQPFKDVRGGSPLFDHQLNWAALLSFKWLAPLVLLVAAAVIYLVPESASLPGWLGKMTQSVSHGKEAAAPEPVASDAQVVPPAASAAEMAGAASVPASVALSASGGVGGSLVLDSADASASAPVQAAAQDPRLVQAVSSPVAPAALPNTPVAMNKATSPGSSGVSASDGPLVLTVGEDSWIEVRDGKGGKLLSRHVTAGETLNLDGPAPLSLRIGNAPGVQVSYRGQAVDLKPLTRNNVARVELK